jgi:membrane peptidoglycan carboxypeptidase
MAAAVSAVANGGTLYEPRVVRAFIHDGQREEIPHRALRTAISAETAATLTTMMEAVVERGTARAAQIPGYTIAGKTGTASKIVDRRYSRSDYYASFAGFVPSRKPEFVIVVVIDSPHARGYYGGTVAAPVFKRIAEAALLHRGIPPTLNALPPVLVASLEEQEKAPRVATEGDDTLVRAMEAIDAEVVPDVRGLSARDAVRALARAGLNPRVTGRGVVIEQSPEPGSPLAPGTAGTITLGRAQPPPATGGQQ